jgi:hypothetical protein
MVPALAEAAIPSVVAIMAGKARRIVFELKNFTKASVFIGMWSLFDLSSFWSEQYFRILFYF